MTISPDVLSTPEPPKRREPAVLHTMLDEQHRPNGDTEALCGFVITASNHCPEGTRDHTEARECPTCEWMSLNFRHGLDDPMWDSLLDWLDEDDA